MQTFINKFSVFFAVLIFTFPVVLLVITLIAEPALSIKDEKQVKIGDFFAKFNSSLAADRKQPKTKDKSDLIFPELPDLEPEIGSEEKDLDLELFPNIDVTPADGSEDKMRLDLMLPAAAGGGAGTSFIVYSIYKAIQAFNAGATATATTATATATTGATGFTAGATGFTAGATGAVTGATGAVAGATGAVAGATGAVAGATGAVAGATGAVAGATGAVAGATGATGATIGATANLLGAEAEGTAATTEGLAGLAEDSAQTAANGVRTAVRAGAGRAIRDVMREEETPSSLNDDPTNRITEDFDDLPDPDLIENPDLENSIEDYFDEEYDFNPDGSETETDDNFNENNNQFEVEAEVYPGTEGGEPETSEEPNEPTTTNPKSDVSEDLNTLSDHENNNVDSEEPETNLPEETDNFFEPDSDSNPEAENPDGEQTNRVESSSENEELFDSETNELAWDSTNEDLTLENDWETGWWDAFDDYLTDLREELFERETPNPEFFEQYDSFLDSFAGNNEQFAGNLDENSNFLDGLEGRAEEWLEDFNSETDVNEEFWTNEENGIGEKNEDAQREWMEDFTDYDINTIENKWKLAATEEDVSFADVLYDHFRQQLKYRVFALNQAATRKKQKEKQMTQLFKEFHKELLKIERGEIVAITDIISLHSLFQTIDIASLFVQNNWEKVKVAFEKFQTEIELLQIDSDQLTQILPSSIMREIHWIKTKLDALAKEREKNIILQKLFQKEKKEAQEKRKAKSSFKREVEDFLTEVPINQITKLVDQKSKKAVEVLKSSKKKVENVFKDGIKFFGQIICLPFKKSK